MEHLWTIHFTYMISNAKNNSMLLALFLFFTCEKIEALTCQGFCQNFLGWCGSTSWCSCKILALPTLLDTSGTLLWPTWLDSKALDSQSIHSTDFLSKSPQLRARQPLSSLLVAFPTLFCTIPLLCFLLEWRGFSRDVQKTWVFNPPTYSGVILKGSLMGSGRRQCGTEQSHGLLAKVLQSFKPRS